MPRLSSSKGLFKGRHFGQEVVVLCVRWYLGYKLSYRDLVAILGEHRLYFVVMMVRVKGSAGAPEKDSLLTKRYSRTPLVDQISDQAGPSRLVTCPDPRAVIAVEVFVEEQAISPMRIVLKFLRFSKYRTPAAFVPAEQAYHAVRDFFGHLTGRR